MALYVSKTEARAAIAGERGDATDLGGVDEGVRAAENDCLLVRIQMTLGVGVDTTSPKCCDSMLLDVIEIHTSSDGSCKQD